MSSRRIPEVESTAVSSLFLLLNVIALACALNAAYEWTVYFMGASQVLYWGTVLHQHIHRTYPHEELS